MNRLELRKTAPQHPRRWLGWCLPVLALCLAPISFVPRLVAETTPGTTPAAIAPATLSSNRFLFVVDISAGMRSHSADIRGAVETILRSSANGQLHPGDTIGVWTFNEDIHTGLLPLQTWVPQDSEEIILRTSEFLRQQHFDKRSRFNVRHGRRG